MLSFDLFVRDMMLDAGFKANELYDDVIEETGIVVFDRLTILIIEKLSDQDKVKFMEEIEKGDIDAALEFASIKIPKYETWVFDQLGDIKDEYITSIKKGA
jgi:hypothetical protein